jgi:hypothetical protein
MNKKKPGASRTFFAPFNKQDALAAWSHYQETGLHVTASEADAWLAKLESGKTAAPPNATTEADLGP